MCDQAHRKSYWTAWRTSNAPGVPVPSRQATDGVPKALQFGGMHSRAHRRLWPGFPRNQGSLPLDTLRAVRRTSGGVGAGRCRAPSASRSAARAAAPAGVWNGNSAAAGGKKRARPGSRAQCRSAKQNVVSISRGKRSLKYLRARGRAEPRGSSGATSHPRPAHCLGAAVSWLMNLPRGRQRSVRRSAPGRQAARARGEGFGVRVRGRTAGSRPAAAPGGPAVARAARASGCAYCG
jgi:hypothetical protein